MHRGRWKYVFSFLLVCMLVITAIFLPQAYSRLWDGKYQEHVTLFSREQSLISHEYDTSIEQKIKILTREESGAEPLRPVRQTRENAGSQEKLVEKLTEELKQMSANSMTDRMLSYDLQDCFQSAQLYSVKDSSDTENSGDSVLFWQLKFENSDGFYGEVCLDAYTYTIYCINVLQRISYSREMLENYRISATDASRSESMVDYEEIFESIQAYATDYLKVEEGSWNAVGMETEVWMHAVLGQTKFDIKSRQTFDDRGFYAQLGLGSMLDWTDSNTTEEK